MNLERLCDQMGRYDESRVQTEKGGGGGYDLRLFGNDIWIATSVELTYLNFSVAQFSFPWQTLVAEYVVQEVVY